MASANVLEIVQTADLVITDAAREVANDLGISIVSEEDSHRAKQSDRPVEQAAPPIGTSEAAVVTDVKRRSPPSPHRQDVPLVLNDSLVRAVVDAIKLRWRPVRQRYTRQLVGPEKL